MGHPCNRVAEVGWARPRSRSFSCGVGLEGGVARPEVECGQGLAQRKRRAEPERSPGLCSQDTVWAQC